MVLLVWILVFLSQCKAGSSQTHMYLYRTPGQDVVLQGSENNTCPTVWTFYKYPYPVNTTELPCETPQRESPQSDRIRLEKNCGFVITNITTKDAGYYVCRRAGQQDMNVYLSVLDVSLETAGADPQTDDEVILECSLSKHSLLDPCKINSLRWVDSAGTVLLGKGVGYEFLGQVNCLAYLKVQRQSGYNRKYTCQLVNEENGVEIQADYTPKFISDSGTQEQNYFLLAMVVKATVLLLLIVAVILVTYKTRRKAAGAGEETAQQPLPPGEPSVSFAHETPL